MEDVSEEEEERDSQAPVNLVDDDALAREETNSRGHSRVSINWPQINEILPRKFCGIPAKLLRKKNKTCLGFEVC